MAHSSVFIERLLTLLIGTLENLIHGVVILGWPSLVFVLKQIGYFSDVCADTIDNDTYTPHANVYVPTPLSFGDTGVLQNDSFAASPMPTGSEILQSSCPEQDAKLQLLFSISTAVQSICMFPVGLLLDKLGTRVTRVIMSVLMSAGYLFMGFSSPQRANLLFPGTILLTIAGTMMMLSSMQIANLFGYRKSTVISLLNGSYSGSLVLFLIIKSTYESGFSMHASFFILAGSTLLFSVNTFVFLPSRFIPWPLPESYRLVKWGNNHDISKSPSCDKHVTYFIKESVEDAVQTVASDTPDVSLKSFTESLDNETEDRKRRKYTSVSSCLKSTTFWLIFLWQTILQLDMSFTFSTLNYFLTRLADGDEKTVSYYTTIFSCIQVLVIVAAPAGGLLMDRNKVSKISVCRKGEEVRGPYSDLKDSCFPLALTTVLSICYTICLLVPSLPLQYATFVFILLLSSMLFGIGISVTTIAFPMEYFATVYGAMRTLGGVCMFLQYPLFRLIQTVFDNHPFYVIIAIIVADATTFSLPAYLFFHHKAGKKRRIRSSIL